MSAGPLYPAAMPDMPVGGADGSALLYLLSRGGDSTVALGQLLADLAALAPVQSVVDPSADLIVTSGGQPARLPMALLPLLNPPATAWLDQSGLAITDENGSPVLG